LNTTLLYLSVGVGLFALGLYGLLLQQQLLRKIIALNIMGSGVFLILVTLSRRGNTTLIINNIDPIPQAMVLTGIVVSVSATAFAVALIRKLHAKANGTILPEDSLE
jgi:multicomponent Na+:H+ antiporter subunit C